MGAPHERVEQGVADGSDPMEQLATEGEVRLPSFTSEELVAVGANSPLRGLLISERLSEMGPIPLTAALGAALRSLVARGYVDPDVVAAELATEDGTDEVDVPLEGELALVVGLRRSPDFVGLVSAPKPAALAGLSLASAGKTEIVLHGLLRAAGPAVLEERRSPLGVHRFALRSLSVEAHALVAWLQGELTSEGGARRADAGGIAVEVELALPGSSDELGSVRHQWSVVLDASGEKASLLAESGGHDAVGLTPEELGECLAAALTGALAPANGETAAQNGDPAAHE